MSSVSPKPSVILALAIVFALQNAWASGTVTIKIPMGSKMSLVQRLNREGVEEVTKHRYDKAEVLIISMNWPRSREAARISL
jgi:hypothetical protein